MQTGHADGRRRRSVHGARSPLPLTDVTRETAGPGGAAARRASDPEERISWRGRRGAFGAGRRWAGREEAEAGRAVRREDGSAWGSDEGWNSWRRGGSWRRGPESNRRIKVLQTSPLPLGYRALKRNSKPAGKRGPARSAPATGWSGRRDLNPRPSPWQGDALPLSYSRMVLPEYIGRVERGQRGRDVSHPVSSNDTGRQGWGAHQGYWPASVEAGAFSG